MIMIRVISSKVLDFIADLQIPGPRSASGGARALRLRHDGGSEAPSLCAAAQRSAAPGEPVECQVNPWGESSMKLLINHG